MFLEEIGRIAITLAGLDIEDESLCLNKKPLMDKLSSVERKLRYVEWVPVLRWKKIKETFAGTEPKTLDF